ncbi:shufflon system plasmid conjugative transfer pilus tip adhesin PilV [Chromobacterium vaccinii]|uniref:shufflon system plasmid conjugative transfer pilus tip adhesin PilV n=1 Tax=Chromobacterium vaccinii TaxID=1108595 RepID=UPI001E3DEE2E|nr:shufflon system plasmid conjugative transfer pilus tip adhesin PilV [Chromobacterium vaccinii]MCD4485200.1 shufflon system plasmid conjugative transfer pilus tip adhesin PilV [Chromobacterium vaccinii]
MRRKQTGELLISLAIAVTLIGMCLAYLGVRQVNDWRESRGRQLGGALAGLARGVNSYVVEYHPKIVEALFASGPPIPLVDKGVLVAKDVLQPTVQEIVKYAGMGGFGDKPPGTDGNYKIVLKKGSQCADAATCNIDALTYVDQPLILPYPSASDKVDYVAAATAVQTIGVNGGMSMLQSKQFLTFPDNRGQKALQMDNPDSRKQGGIVAVRGGYLRSDMDQFLRRDGSRPMTGNLDMGGGNIGAAKDIVGTGSLTMDGSAIVAGSMVAFQNITAGADLSAGGNLTVEKQATMKGELIAKERLTANKYLQLGGDSRAVIGADCSPNGLVGRDEDGLILSCQRLKWAPGGFSQTKPAVAEVETCGKQSMRPPKGDRGNASIAYCEEGARLVAGGYYLTGWPNQADQHLYEKYTLAPEESAPLAFYTIARDEYPQGFKSRNDERPLPRDKLNREGWYVWTGGAESGCWKAVAMCTK